MEMQRIDCVKVMMSWKGPPGPQSQTNLPKRLASILGIRWPGLYCRSERWQRSRRFLYYGKGGGEVWFALFEEKVNNKQIGIPYTLESGNLGNCLYHLLSYPIRVHDKK